MTQVATRQYNLASLFLLILALIYGSPALSQNPADKASRPASLLEKVEWTWADRAETIDPALPNVLLVGDSITRAYFPDVAKLLAGQANVYLFATSCASGDPRLPGQLHDYFSMQPVSFSVIHFNNGMHGWAYADSAYTASLPDMVSVLRKDQPRSRLIWSSTTPVRADKPGGAANARIDERNAGAAAIMKRAGIPIDDQHLLMESHNDLHADDVHYIPAGSKIQAQQVVETISNLLPAEPSTSGH
jgi:hypothetical protein